MQTDLIINRALLQQYAEIIETPSLPRLWLTQHLALAKRPECIDLTCAAFSQKMPNAVVRAVPKRQYEFIIGRLAAGVLLIENGIPAEDSWIASWHRQPVWPKGIIGSISHSSELVSVAVRPKGYGIDSIGIDIEYLDQNSQSMRALTRCFTHKERALLEQIENGLIIGFSIKESLFKCLHPMTGNFFDFLDAQITYADTISQSVDCVLQCNLGEGLNSGTCLQGKYRIFRNHVWTGVFWSDTDKV